MLTFSSGSSSIPDTARAATAAVLDAISGHDISRCRVIIFHATMGHVFQTIANVIRACVPGARVVGNSCAGVVGRRGADESLRTLALMAVFGEPHEVVVAYRDGIDGVTARQRVRDAAWELRLAADNIRFAMFIGPGIDIAMDDAIAGFEDVFGSRTVLFGGTASDNMKGVSSFQCIDDAVYQRAGYLIGFADQTLEVESQASHGFVPIDVELEVTASSGNLIKELDGSPAWRTYTHALGLPANATPGDTIPPGALGMRLPKELADEYSDSHLLRVVTHRHAADGFFMPVNCAVGTRLSLMRRNEDRIFDNLAIMMERLASRLGEARPLAVFHTDCGARGRLLLDRVSKDEIVADMQKPLYGDDIGPWLGMYGFGEITVLGGRNQFHNYTTSLYVIVRRASGE